MLSFYPTLFYTAATSKGVNNSTPREQKKHQTGLGARLQGAHYVSLSFEQLLESNFLACTCSGIRHCATVSTTRTDLS